MAAIDPVQVLREKMKQIDRLLEEFVKLTEDMKHERVALMVAIAALEREAGK